MGFRWDGLQMQTIQELGAVGVLLCEYLFVLLQDYREGFFILPQDAEMGRVDSRPQVLERRSEVPLYHWYNASKAVRPRWRRAVRSVHSYYEFPFP